MANVAIQFRRGTTSNHSSFAGLIGELTVDTTKKTVVVHDGSTNGGTPLAKEVHTHTASDVSGLRYQTIQISGSAQTQQPILNLSSLFSATNDVGGTRTTVTLSNNNTSGAGTYGTTTRVPQITVSATGLITSVSEVTVAGVTPAGTASGDLSGTYPGPTVASVGGQSASNVAAATALANAGTNAGTANTLVKRDNSGNFTANVVTADLVGNVSGNVSGTAATITGNLTGDVTSIGMATTLASSGVSAGTYGSATQVARITVDAKGRVTGVTQVTVTGVAPAGGAGGDLTGSYPSPTVGTVGGVAAASIATGVGLANNSTSASTVSTVVKRDGKGSANFAVTYEKLNNVSTSSTPSFDLSNGAVQTMTIDDDITIAFTGLTASQTHIVVFDFIHDATTTNYAITWPANVFGGTANVGVAANKHNVQAFYSDGTNLYSLGQMRTDL